MAVLLNAPDSGAFVVERGNLADLELSSRPREHVVPDDAAKQTVVDAYEQGAQLAALDNRYVKLAELSMQMVGLELARNVMPGEHAAFCVPVQVASGSKVNPGAVLVLEHRVVIAWSEGVLRPKPHSVAYELSDVGDVRSFTRKVGRVSAELDAISFVAHDSTVEIVFHSEVSHERVTPTVHGVLNGGVTYNWNEQAT